MLAATRCHLYVRWDSLPNGECFNIEASGDGVSFFPDEYYRTGRYAMPQETIQACGYLQSLSPREEIGSFMEQRGECWMQERNYALAAQSYAWANELDARRQQHPFLTWQTARCWDEQLRMMVPPRFPRLDIGLPPREFLQLPRELERELVRMCVMEGLLTDKKYREESWEPLRRNPNLIPTGFPSRMRIDYPSNAVGQEIVKT
jgi:hypothetical protein